MCGRRITRDLDVDGASITLILGDGGHGEAVGVLLSAHKGASPGVEAVGGGSKVDVVGVQIGPVPVPVDGVDGARLEVAGQLKGGLASKLNVMVGSLRGEFGSSLSADGTGVWLVTLAIVVVAGSQENAATVTSSARLVPNKVDIKETLALLGLAGAVEEDSTAVQGLLGLILGESSVTVLKMDNGYVVARSGFQHRKRRVLIQLVLVQHLIPRISTLASSGENPLRDAVSEGRVSRSARDPASSVSFGSNHGAVGGDLEGTLDPGVTAGDGGESCNHRGLEADARFGSHSHGWNASRERC